MLTFRFRFVFVSMRLCNSSPFIRMQRKYLRGHTFYLPGQLRCMNLVLTVATRTIKTPENDPFFRRV